MKKILIVLMAIFPMILCASGFVKMSIDAVVQDADVGFEGVCVDSKAYTKNLKGYTRPQVVTDYKFKVTKWFKKPDGLKDLDSFAFTQRGVSPKDAVSVGVYGNTWYPYFVKQNTYFLFLKKMPDGLMLPVGTMMGKADVVENADGTKTVKNSYMKSLIKKSPMPATKALSVDVGRRGEMNYNLFIKAVEQAEKTTVPMPDVKTPVVEDAKKEQNEIVETESADENKIRNEEVTGK